MSKLSTLNQKRPTPAKKSTSSGTTAWDADGFTGKMGTLRSAFTQAKDGGRWRFLCNVAGKGSPYVVVYFDDGDDRISEVVAGLSISADDVVEVREQKRPDGYFKLLVPMNPPPVDEDDEEAEVGKVENITIGGFPSEEAARKFVSVRIVGATK